MSTGWTGEDDVRDPFQEFTGDRDAAARLRAGLEQVAAENPGTDTAELIAQVLAGRRPIRDLADDPGFATVMEQGMDDYRRHLESLTPQERAQLVEQAQQSESRSRG